MKILPFSIMAILFIEEQFSVFSKNIYNDEVVLRIVSKNRPTSSAKEVTPTLNDAYILKIDEDEKSYVVS